MKKLLYLLPLLFLGAFGQVKVPKGSVITVLNSSDPVIEKGNPAT